MPHVGNDGFSDCDKLCGSGHGYSVSCVKICPGFKIPTETQTVSTVTIEDGYKAPVEVTFDLTSLATIIGCAIAAVVILLMVYCLRHTIRKLWQRWRKRFIKMPIQVQQHRSTAAKELIAAESGTMQQQPESNIPINIPPIETDRLLLQEVKDEVSNEMTILPPLETVNPEKNLNKITPDPYNTSNGEANNNTLKRSGIDPDHDEYVDIQSIMPQQEHVYDNVSESRNRIQDPRQINSSMDSVNTTGTVFENDGDDMTYEEGCDVGSSERAGTTYVRIVTEMRV